MKLIKSKVELIQENDPCKMIEIAGRTCYKSEENTTEDSAKEFVNRMIKSGHGAMLEHGTVYLQFSKYKGDPHKYESNKYSVMCITGDKQYYVTTNLRVLVENDWLDDLEYQCEPTEHHEKRVTVRFTCDRGVSHEFVRHRVFSFAQESTRYCNYGKDKFGNELTFIIPSWLDWGEQTIHRGDFEKSGSGSVNSGIFINCLLDSESSYMQLINEGWRPQQARQVLPNAIKTELVMTGFESDWEGFFKLRCSKAAHPDAKKLADELQELMK